MNKLTRTLALISLIAAPAAVRAQDLDGMDFPTAIPIVFGQVVTDIGDSKLKERQFYKVALARGQKFSVSLSNVDNKNVSWSLYLIAPDVKSVATWKASDTLSSEAQNCCNANKTRSITYQVAASGTYFVAVYFGEPGVNYKLQVLAEGTPIAVANPPSAGCLSGQVSSITYSLQYIAMGLPDEVVIGGSRACASCQVKAPIYRELAERLDNALRSRLNVDACYDSSGNLFQIKMTPQ